LGSSAFEPASIFDRRTGFGQEPHRQSSAAVTKAESLTLLLIHSQNSSVVELAGSLTAHGHHVNAVVDVDTGHLATRVHPYDCVVVSFAKPTDAIDLARILRTESSVPIIVIASTKTVDERVEALEAGADDCLVPPVTQRELVTRIGAILRRTRTPRGP
jgi:DNA-binding response OmpR family regulator